MHELGHTFGLDHGPINSFSVMSGLIHEEQAPYNRILDYNRYPIDALDESALSEPDGLESTPAGESVPRRRARSLLLPQRPEPAPAPAADGRRGVERRLGLRRPSVPLSAALRDRHGAGRGQTSTATGVVDIIPAQPNDWESWSFDNGRIGG